MANTMKPGVCIDLGASSTRVTGQDSNIYFLPNTLIFLDQNENIGLEKTDVSVHDEETFLTNMDFIISKTSGEKNPAFPARALVGKLADRKSDSVIGPSAMESKHAQSINMFNAIVAIAEQAYLYGYDGTPLSLYIALPPLECTPSVQEEMKLKLTGSYNVLSERLGWEVNLNIENVKIYSECYMALAAFFFDFPACKPNADHMQKYGTGYVLGIDIGASTTDWYIVENGKPIEKSGQTIRTGCNVIEMNIASQIRQRYGFDPNPEVRARAMAEGRIQMGRGFEEIGDIVQSAKKQYARSIVAEIDNYFRLINIPLNLVIGIVTAGGGSLKSSYTDAAGNEVVTCGCTSEFITTELARIVSNIDVVPIDDPRTANVRGLFIRMMMDKALEAKAAKEAASA